MNTHGEKISFGKHKGTLFTRVPIGYLRWMVNQGEKLPQYQLAKSEFERRGDTMPLLEISGHAIDRASLRVRKIWHETRGEDEGLYSWLQRVTLEAIKQPEVSEGRHDHLGMKFIIEQGAEFPSLKTIMRLKGASNES